ncbi:MAG: DUF6600 domain-containing protein [Rhodanobacter sp.]
MRSSAEVLASWLHRCRIFAMLLLCAAAAATHAQTDDDVAGPPGRVARLSYVAGNLGFLAAGATDWSDASINRPLTTGDRLSAGQGSRAELELGGGTLRMADHTEFGVLELSDQIAQFELTEGSLDITVRQLDEGQSYEIDTPTVALVIDQPGTFRVDIGDDGGSDSTRVTALDGRATVYGENNAQREVLAGRSYRFVDSSLAVVAINDVGGGDAFDNWSSERDRSDAQSNTGQYVSDDVIGSQDLDQYGDWQETEDYGAVWFPTHVAADWAPYRDGHWAYIAPWGWTWVDNSRWGFAPYHYGRWAYVRNSWGWIPGPRGVRSVYAPALVAFVGGGGWSVGIGGGPVGWFPLGPGDIYNPWYRCGRRCYTDVNFNNMRGRHGDDRDRFIARIHDRYSHYQGGMPMRGEHYANRDMPRGFTAVPGPAFAGGRNVRRDLLPVDPRQLASAPVLTRGTNLRPASGATASARGRHPRVLPAGDFQRDVVARHDPLARSFAGNSGSAPDQPGIHNRQSVGNVHLLDQDRRAARGPATTAFDRSARNPDFSRNIPTNAGVAVPDDRNRGGGESRRGELPSARFAHLPSQDMSDRNDADRRQSLRNGEGYISGAGDNQSRETYRGASTLPVVPQIQRATPIRQTAPAGRTDTGRMTNGEMRYSQTRRFEPGNDAAREDLRPASRPVYQPVRAEPQRQSEPTRYEQPRYAQPQRATPTYRQVSRPEQPSPSRGDSHPSGKSAPGVREDARGH